MTAMAEAWCAWVMGPDGFGPYEVEFVADGPKFTSTDRDPEWILSPGLVDLHFHGAFGFDFMSSSTAELVELADRLEGVGYEAVLLTTVTAPFEAVREAFRRLPDHRAIAGVHLEGPFLSPEYPGAQPEEFLELPPRGPSDWDEIFTHPALRVLTMAPEIAGALELANRIDRSGLTLSMGHTAATFLEADAAAAAGFRLVTHCFNAMRGLHHREAGALGCALLRPALTAELIYDRVHVVAEAAEILLQMKGLENVVAVSDSSLATGLPVGTELEMWGHRVVVAEKDVRLAEGGSLAGSTITLREAFRNLLQDFGPETAIRLCTVNPRQILGLGQPHVWLRWSLDGALEAAIRRPR